MLPIFGTSQHYILHVWDYAAYCCYAIVSVHTQEAKIMCTWHCMVMFFNYVQELFILFIAILTIGVERSCLEADRARSWMLSELRTYWILILVAEWSYAILFKGITHWIWAYAPTILVLYWFVIGMWVKLCLYAVYLCLLLWSTPNLAEAQQPPVHLTINHGTSDKGTNLGPQWRFYKVTIPPMDSIFKYW